MENERERILKMVEEGTMSADEAHELLAALDDESAVDAGQAQALPQEMDQPWEVPFFGGLIVSAFGILGLLRAPRDDGKLARRGAWLTLLLGALGIAVGYWSRSAHWLHVQVQERDGDQIKISLPLPLGLADQILSLVLNLVDEETRPHVENAGAFLDALKRGETGDPFTVEVDDGEGDRVLIYIG
jgi:hypothetical protein